MSYIIYLQTVCKQGNKATCVQRCSNNSLAQEGNMKPLLSDWLTPGLISLLNQFTWNFCHSVAISANILCFILFVLLVCEVKVKFQCIDTSNIQIKLWTRLQLHKLYYEFQYQVFLSTSINLQCVQYSVLLLTLMYWLLSKAEVFIYKLAECMFLL